MIDRLNESDASAGEEYVLRLEDITVRFGGIQALDGVCLSVRPKEIYGLIGPNGAGKTTLFDVVSGVRRPNQGRVLLAGRDVSRLDPPDRYRLGLRRTFQRVQTFGWLTVEDNVLTATEWRGGGGGLLADLLYVPGRRRLERERRRLVDAALERCGLTPIRAESAGSLPTGVARMVEFARATVEPPLLLLLDEPASGLGDEEIVRLGDQIEAIRQEHECAVLLVEHNASFVMKHCDRVAVLAQGSVLAEGLPEEIQANETVRSAYLGEV